MDVDPVALAASAARAGDVARDLLAAHARGEALFEEVQPGWAGASAVTLGGAARWWAATIPGICARLDGHAATLQLAAAAFAAGDETAAAVLSGRRR